MDLLDYLIRPLQERRRDREAEGFGGLEVDDQIELRDLLEGKISRLCTLQDLINVVSSASIQLPVVWRVSEQSAILRIGLYVIDGGDAEPCGKSNHAVDVRLMCRVRRHEEYPRRLLRDCAECDFQLRR